MSINTLPITNIIDVNVTLLSSGLAGFNVNNLALITSDQFLSNPTGDLFRVYTSLQEVGNDFGTTTETYQQAAAVFAQTPNMVGAGGNLLIFPAFEGTALNSITVSAGGSGYKLGDVVTVSETGASGGTVTISAVNNSGTVSSITLLTGGVGYSTTTSAVTTGGAGSGLTVTVSTLTSETLAQAVARCQNYTYFVGVISTNYGSNSTWLGLSNEVQGYNNLVLALPSNNIADIQGVFTSIQQASNDATRCLYYSNSNSLQARLYAAAYMSRLLSVNINGSNTAINMNLQQLQTIVADVGITQNIVSLCHSAGVDIYPSTAGYPGVYSNGANQFSDTVWNIIAFVAQLQVNGFNCLATAGSKVPQTERGVTQLKNSYKQACLQFVNNGFIAPGTWESSQIIGNQADLISNIAQYGYYIYSQPVNTLTSTQIANRQAPVISIAIKQASGINSSIVNVYVN